MGIGLGMKYTERSSGQMEITNMPDSENYELMAERDSIQRVRLLPESSDPN